MKTTKETIFYGPENSFKTVFLQIQTLFRLYEMRRNQLRDACAKVLKK